MKILVDKMPEKMQDCPRHYIAENGVGDKWDACDGASIACMGVDEYINRTAAVCIADYAADEHPYSKERGKPETYSDYNQGWNDACDYIRGKIESERAADAEHVVRCKDCKYYGIDRISGGFCRQPKTVSMWSPGLPIDELKPDDYCSRGERK